MCFSFALNLRVNLSPGTWFLLLKHNGKYRVFTHTLLFDRTQIPNVVSITVGSCWDARSALSDFQLCFLLGFFVFFPMYVYSGGQQMIWGCLCPDFEAPLFVALSFRGFSPLISSCSHRPKIYITSTYLKPVRLQHLMWVLTIRELYALEGKSHVKYGSHPMWFLFFKGSIFSGFCFFWSFSSAFK